MAERVVATGVCEHCGHPIEQRTFRTNSGEGLVWTHPHITGRRATFCFPVGQQDTTASPSPFVIV